MSKDYTKRTASLRAVKINTRVLDAKDIVLYPGQGDKSIRKNILEVIGNNVSLLDERGENITDYDLWGIAVEGKRIRNKWISADIDETIKDSVAAVSHNKAFDTNGDFIFNIECNKIKNAINSFNTTTFISFDDNLDNLEVATGMFKESSVTQIGCDFPLLVKADEMFANSSITLFNNEVQELRNANGMFKNTKQMTSFTTTLPNLYEAVSMFEGSTITSFSSYVPYLYKGVDMFRNSDIEEVDASFSTLLDGTGMFENTNLSIDSVRIIAQTLPMINDYTYNEDDATDNTKYYTWANGASFKYGMKVWDDEKEDTVNSYDTLTIDPQTIGEIMITWKDTSKFTKEEKAVIIYDYFKLMTLKGWTVITNLYEDDTEEPTGIYGRIVESSDSTTATHTKDGKYYNAYTAQVVHYPITGLEKRNWVQYDSIEIMETTLGITSVN